MNSIYEHYIIDLSSNNNFVQVPTVQGDGNGIRGFEVELIQNGVPYVIDKNDTFIFIMGTKPDTKQIMNDCALTDDGFILVDITSQMSAVKGRGDFQIVLMSRSTNSQLKSFPFYIITTPSAFDMDYIASSDEFQSLTRNITRTEEVIDEANLAISDVRTLESSVKKAEESRVSAEKDRADAENMRVTNEDARKAAETARQTAETSRNDAENTRKSNESTRQTNESVRQTNTATAITNASNAANRANNAAEICEGFIETGVVLQTEKGIAGGVATLDSNSKIPLAQIPGIDLPVSANMQTALDAYYQQSSGYTDQKIAALINGAPSTLDTLGEIAQAMKDNESVVAALDAAVGKKASAAEFDSHVKNKSNPHSVTKAQIGLGNVDNTADSKKSVSYAASSGNADTVDGFHASTAANANTIVTRDNSGYSFFNYINSSTANDENPLSMSQVIVTNGTDGYYRKASLAHLKAHMGLNNVDNTADSQKSVSYANSSGSANSANYASSAGSVAYSNVSGRPTFSLSGTTLSISF